MLLGDVLEFRDRPFAEAMELAKPTLAKLGGLSAGEVIVVPGNHDYRLIAGWLEARALRGARPLRLSEKARLDLWPASELRAGDAGREAHDPATRAYGFARTSTPCTATISTGT